jgi:RHS repeat-associated protein
VFDGADNLLMRFEYADGRMPVAMTRGGARYYLAYDQVGTLRVVTDSTGAVVKRIDYDTFGNVVADTNPAFSVPFGFAGGLHDRDTGLVRFGYRDYDPETGRWTAKDPILFAGGDVGLYGYCLNDPVNLVDLMGLSVSSFVENFAKGVAVGAVTGVAIGAVAVGAAAAGVPVAVVTGTLGAVAAVGAIVGGANIGMNICNENWDGVAHSVGTFSGGFALGFAGAKIPEITGGSSGNPIVGRAVAEGINGVKSGFFRWNDSFQNYQPGKGTIVEWLGTGPNPGSAALSITGSSGIVSAATSSPCE